MPLRAMPRYFLLPPLQATIGTSPARLIDLSLRGVRVETVEPLSIGTSLRLRIFAAGVAVDAMGTVVWSQIDDLSLNDRSDRYLSGLTFDEEAPRAVGELIQKLLEADVAVAIEDCRNTDRYRLATPLTGSFGPRHASVVDLSINGARLAVRQFLRPGSVETLGFQVDLEMGPIIANATVVWCIGDEGGFEAGLKIEAQEDRLRLAIHRLCMRGEARIDLHSLRRKFDSLRAAARAVDALAS